MEAYIEKDGKRLRLGYTTGSCAAAAAKAAAWMLLTGREKREITLLPPKGMELRLDVEDICREETQVTCAIRKDGGDDPDVTHGTLIYARVFRQETPGVAIDGGVGVGRVTKPGLDQDVGEAAINSVPRKMIRENVAQVMALMDYHGGLGVEISVPEGERLAKQTFNPRLGILGGISILGTTGIVEPMSEKALVDTIRVELTQRRRNGADFVLLTPGNYGSDFIRQELGIDPTLAVQCSNYIQKTLEICRKLEFRGALLIGHIGKLVKVAGGMGNTHSKYGDCRMEILAAHAGAAGLDRAHIAGMLGCVACDEALRLLREGGCWEPALTSLTGKIGEHLARFGGETLETGAIVYSKEYGILGLTENARELLEKCKEGASWCIL